MLGIKDQIWKESKATHLTLYEWREVLGLLEDTEPGGTRARALMTGTGSSVHHATPCCSLSVRIQERCLRTQALRKNHPLETHLSPSKVSMKKIGHSDTQAIKAKHKEASVPTIHPSCEAMTETVS